MTRPVRVTVLGGGSWGTTVAALAAAHGPATVWARDAEVAREIREEHTNQRYLEDRSLPEALSATADLREAVADCDVLVCGVPSYAMREVLEDVSPHLRAWVPVLSLSKGLEPRTRLRPTEIITEVLPGRPVGVLSGPNLAREVLDGLAAASVIATADEHVACALQPLFSSPRFRVYRNKDVIGSELGGILKNVIAIAVGMADGLDVGDNTRAMVITRGLAEMTRLGEALGADPRTFAGLTGMGDLVATCSSRLSRNRRVGEGLARGRTPEEISDEMGQVAEGVRTVGTVMELAHEYGVTMPITFEVDAVVNHGADAAKAYRGLRRHEAADEIYGAA